MIWFIFVMSIGFFVMVMTNFIMNVAAIVTSLPVALVIAPYLGAAPNAIAYDSKQFTTGEFFIYGVYSSIILMVILAFAIYFLWPLMGMRVKL